MANSLVTNPAIITAAFNPNAAPPNAIPNFSRALIKPAKCQEFPNRYLTQEHFRPLEVGGDFIIGNDQILSRECGVDD